MPIIGIKPRFRRTAAPPSELTPAERKITRILARARARLADTFTETDALRAIQAGQRPALPEQDVDDILDEVLDVLAVEYVEAGEEVAASFAVEKHGDHMPFRDPNLHRAVHNPRFGGVPRPKRQPRRKLAYDFNMHNPYARGFANQAGTMIRNITSGTLMSVQDLLYRTQQGGPGGPAGIAAYTRGLPGGVTGVDVPTLSRMLRNVAGLEPRQSRSVYEFYANQARLGVPYEQRWDMTEKMADRLWRKRATNIARTEVQAIQNAGKFDSWRAAAAEGLIDPRTAGKEWRLAETGYCAKCAPYVGQRVRLEQDFDGGIKMPPRHPSCRCTAVIIPDAFEPGDMTTTDEQRAALGADDDKWLLGGPAVLGDRLAGGAGGAFKGTVGGRGVVVKPVSMFRKSKIHSGISAGNDHGRERAAYLVSQRMGVKVPATHIRPSFPPDFGEVLIKEFVTNGMDSSAAPYQQLSKALDAMSLYDSVTANLDRHAGNYMWDGQDMWAVDEGLSFPEFVAEPKLAWNQDQMLARKRVRGDTWQDLDEHELAVLQRLIDAEIVLRRDLKGLISKRAQDLMFHRIRWMQTNRKIAWGRRSWNPYGWSKWKGED